MTPLDELRNDGEEVVAELRPHWSFMAGPVVGSLVLVAGIIAAVAAAPGLPTPVWLAVCAVVVVDFCWLVGRYARWVTTRFAVTATRVICQRGVLRRHGREIPLSRIADIGFSQSVLERIVGSGTLLIESPGRAGQEAFTNIPRPAQVQRAIYRQMERSEQAGLAVRGQPVLSIPEQIEKLDELYRRGVITRVQFETKRDELLDRL